MIQIDYRDPRPIYEQVVDGIELLALRGVLSPLSQLPSVRQLAMELSINPNTIQRAYSELERRGVIFSSKGRGNFISEDSEGLRQRRLNEIGERVRALLKQARLFGASETQMRAWMAQEEEDET